MAKKTVGELIKEARTEAGMTQEQLAKKIKGISANDISLAERGQQELTQAVLKEIAKATGVTQSSLLEAAKGASKSSSSKKTGSSSGKKTSSSSQSSIKVTTAEKKLIELYRNADADDRKKVLSILKGESTLADDVLGELLGGAMDLIGKLGK